MRFLAALLGFALLAIVAIDAFNTIVLPRRSHHTFRIARAFYRFSWKPYARIGRHISKGLRREAYLSVYGPLTVLLLLAIWAGGMITGFALLQWSANAPDSRTASGLANDFYLSGSRFFTMATGDPHGVPSKWMTVLEGGSGIGLLSLVVAYLPVMYQAFSRRELQISMMDARAGSPPSAVGLLGCECHDAGRLDKQFGVWEQWATELLETQLSYPMLAYFRSQHVNQSWFTSLIAILDSSAIVMLCAKTDVRTQAGLTFATARHMVLDIADVFGVDRTRVNEDRLPDSEFLQLRDTLRSRDSILDPAQLTEQNLRDLRQMYEPAAHGLSEHFLMTLPPWIPGPAKRDNWRFPAQESKDELFTVSDPFQRSH